MVYLTFMTGGGALTAVVLQFFRRQSLAAVFLPPVRVMAAGFFGVALYTVMLAAAFAIAPESDIGQINLLNYLWPVWVVIFGIALLKNRPNPYLTLTGILLGFSGVMVSRGFDQFAQLPTDILAHALSLFGALMFAGYSVLLRKWQIPEDQGGTAFNFAVCSVLSCVIAVILNQWQSMPAWSNEALFWVLFGAVGPVGLAYSWWEIGVKKGPVYLIASLAYFIPIGSSLLIGLIFKESMNNGLFFGGVLIAMGAWLVRYAGREC
jgi:drug/metabolite transporter (DMT)-like permease